MFFSGKVVETGSLLTHFILQSSRLLVVVLICCHRRVIAYVRGESLVSRPGSRQSTAVSLLPIVCIPGGRGLPECPLLRIRQAWPQVDGRRLLTCLCGQLLPPCGYVQLLQLCISGIALTPCGYVWLLQLSSPGPL